MAVEIADLTLVTPIATEQNRVAIGDISLLTPMATDQLLFEFADLTLMIPMVPVDTTAPRPPIVNVIESKI